MTARRGYAVERFLAAEARLGGRLIRAAAYVELAVRAVSLDRAAADRLYPALQRFTPGWSSRSRGTDWWELRRDATMAAQDAPQRPTMTLLGSEWAERDTAR